jgi:transcriptional regulator with XRE-family HTH domain
VKEIDFIDIFSRNLRDAMNYCNMTQRELADASGLDESVISRYLRGHVMPSTRCLVNIAYALDCRVEDLIPCYELVF